MSAYIPQDVMIVGVGAGLGLLGALLGWWLTHTRHPTGARLGAWTLAMALTVVIERASTAEPPGLRMLLIMGTLMIGMKAVVGVESSLRSGEHLSPWRWFGFSLAWFGMRPSVFAARRRPRGDAKGIIRSGAALLLLGVLCIWGARVIASMTASRWPAALLLLPGLSLCLHFGVLKIQTGLWRRYGLPANLLFRSPVHSTSLTEFWGRRWNIAFTELTATTLYRPLRGRVGSSTAMVAAFLFSGLLHEAAISLPVMAGFGTPTLYFLLHGGLLLVERGLSARGLPVAGSLGRAWTLLWLIVPLPLLFHAPFLNGVVWPLLGK